MGKVCYTCKVEKPLSEFYLDRGVTAYRCKVCHNAASHRSQIKHRARKNERSRARYRQDPTAARSASKRWDQRNKPKKLAHALASQKRWPERYVEKVARRRAAKYRATPAWANQFFIGEAYHLAALRTKMLGFKWHVDHIVPLRSPLVCGLHVENNLQVILASVNHEKNNRYWPGMP